MSAAQANVVLIDDDAIFGAICSRHFRGRDAINFEVSTTVDGAEPKLRAGEADFLILDLSLPERDGIEFIRDLPKIGFRGKTAIISSQPRNVIDMACKLAAINDVEIVGTFEKPMTPARFAELERLILADRGDPSDRAGAA